MWKSASFFLALGDEEYDHTLPGEICYLDRDGSSLPLFELARWTAYHVDACRLDEKVLGGHDKY